MATLVQNANDVASCATAIDAAIVAKGGTLVGGGKLRNAAAGIATISGEEPIPDWTPPSDWPNLRTLLANDTETEYTNKAYVLFYRPVKDTVTYNVPKWKTIDGGVYYGNATHTWTSSADYVWVCLYTNASEFSINCLGGNTDGALWLCGNGTINFGSVTSTKRLQCVECGTCKINSIFSNYALSRITNIVLNTSTMTMNWFANNNSLLQVTNFTMSGVTNASQMFSSCCSLLKIPDELDLSACTNVSAIFAQCYNLRAVPDELDLSACTNCANMFQSCHSLTAVPDELDLSACTNCANMFNECYLLSTVPDELDFSACTNVQAIFAQCYNLRAVPDELDLSACTNCESMFVNCYNLRNLPTHLTINLSISFAQSYNVSKDSVATFDADGVVNGGMVYNLNTCSNSGQSVTLSNATKALFTTNQVTAIAAALSAKNWGLSWSS